MASLEGAEWSLLLAPLLIVIGLIYVMPGAISMRSPWARWTLVAVVWAVAARYLWWRATATLITDQGAAETVWSVGCFLVELLAILDGALLYLAFARTSDRRGEADAAEPRLRALTAETAPKVDVFIPTYDEPLAVLEKTIIGACAMDWPNVAIWVLDDKRRPWLRDYCAAKGVGYITRPDNLGAKAGNVNHALTVTDGEFVAIFDADFVPQRQFLMRCMGFFEDPKIGIVQTPHAFYNHDPMQTNLGMRKSLPDDQRFFFEAIMPSRDGWNGAFCCGSNSITRRAALQDVGGALPEGSITEDQLLSLELLRKGYITRYLNERLAYGLAPESVSAFFVQRQRWAQGAIQILFLKAGPLAPGLPLIQRLLFLPTHWLTQGLMCLMCLVTPAVFLLTGAPPMGHTSLEAVVYYVIPMILAMCGGLMAFAPGKYNPLAAQVLGTFQSFKLLPTVLLTLLRPHGHAFKVTPKGANASGAYERGIFLLCLTLILATLAGLAINLSPEWRRIQELSLVPLVALWSAFNIVVLFLVSLLCLQTPARRGEERFPVEEPAVVRNLANGGSATVMSTDMSLSGIGLRGAEDAISTWRSGDPLSVYVSMVGWVPARLARLSKGGIGVHFVLGDRVERDLLVRKLFTGGLNTAADSATALSVTMGLLKRIWTARMDQTLSAAPAEDDTTPVASLPKATLVLAPADTRIDLGALAERNRAAA